MPKSIGMKLVSCTSKYDLNGTRYVDKVSSVHKLLAKINKNDYSPILSSLYIINLPDVYFYKKKG